MIDVHNIEPPEHFIAKAAYYSSLRRKTLLNTTATTTIVIACAFALVILLVFLIFPIEKIFGDNLSPKLEHDDICLAMKQIGYDHGDLVFFNYGDFTLCKRIIGLPGDLIDCRSNGDVYVNDVKLDERYLIEKTPEGFENKYPLYVPEGTYFVLSDNRSVMTDSRYGDIGCVRQDIVVGRVLFRFWPIWEFKLIY